MKRKCKICTDKYDYCPSCSVKENPFKKAGYCKENCYHISMTLQRYGSHLATATETIKALDPYGIDKMSLQPNIESYYKDILNEAEAQKPKRKIKKVEVIPQEDVEVVIKDEDTTTSAE